jgi:hypothetical protein
VLDGEDCDALHKKKSVKVSNLFFFSRCVLYTGNEKRSGLVPFLHLHEQGAFCGRALASCGPGAADASQRGALQRCLLYRARDTARRRSARAGIAPRASCF